MSDTTAFVAGCATTGVAVLVLLVSRLGGSGAEPPVDRVELPPPEQPITAPAVPVPHIPDVDSEELRHDLERQREITNRLETQLSQQEMVARNLENQLQQQQAETRQVLTQLENYQRSLDTLSLQNSQLAESSQPSGSQTTLLWIGGGLFVVLIFGGGGLLIGMLLLNAQAQRRQDRSMPMMYHPIQMPTPPSYRYYEQEFLPPLPTRSRRATPYNPPPQYDYEG